MEDSPAPDGISAAENLSPDRPDAILEWITDAFFVLDREWRYSYANPAWEKVTGKNRSELAGVTIWEAFPEVLGTATEAELRKAAAARVPVSFESHQPAAERWFAVSAYPAGDGGLAVYSREITERKRFEQALLTSEERFRRYFDLGLMGMAITSPSKGCIEVNDEICHILGYPRSELLQKTWAEMTHPDDLAADIAEFQRVVAGEIDGYSMPKRWIRKDGAVVYSTISVQCVRSAGGSIAYFLALLQDITSQTKAEEVVRKARRDLEQRVAERTGQLSVANAELTQQIEERGRAEKESWKLRNELAAELLGMKQLHDFSARLASEANAQPILEELLRAVLALQNADAGWVQLYDAETGTLKVVARRGRAVDFPGNFPGPEEPGSPAWQALSGGVPVVVEDLLSEEESSVSWKTIAPDLGFRSLQFTPVCGRTGEPIGLLATLFPAPRRPSERESRLIDLYARHAAEAIEGRRSQEEQRKLASLAENSQEFIGMASLDGRAQFVNPAGRQLLGLDSAIQVRTTKILDYIAEPDRELFEKQILPATFEYGAWEGETRFRHFRSGDFIPMTQHIFLVRDGGGGVPVALGTIARDLRKRKRAEQALREARAQLAQMERVTTIGELATTIAHEINQPLSAVVANGDALLRWLAQSPPNFEEARGSLKGLVLQAHRASEVVARIRAFVRRSPAQFSRLDPNRLIAEVISLTREEFERHGMEIVTELSPGLPPIRGDRVQIQQVIVNLMLNAIDAACLRTDTPREVLLTTHVRDHAEVILGVHDRGPGIDMTDVEQLFQPFFTTKPSGIGLGLSISRSIVEEHGGRLWARPNPKGGAIFQFSLPIEDGE